MMTLSKISKLPDVPTLKTLKKLVSESHLEPVDKDKNGTLLYSVEEVRELLSNYVSSQPTFCKRSNSKRFSTELIHEGVKDLEQWVKSLLAFQDMKELLIQKYILDDSTKERYKKLIEALGEYCPQEEEDEEFLKWADEWIGKPLTV